MSTASAAGTMASTPATMPERPLAPSPSTPLLRAMLDFSPLSAALDAIQASVEGHSRRIEAGQGRINAVEANQADMQSAMASMRASSDTVSRSELPCTVAEFRSVQEDLKELLSFRSASSDAVERTKDMATEVGELKASVAELQALAQTQAGSIRELTAALKASMDNTNTTVTTVLGLPTDSIPPFLGPSADSLSALLSSSTRTPSHQEKGDWALTLTRLARGLAEGQEAHKALAEQVDQLREGIGEVRVASAIPFLAPTPASMQRAAENVITERSIVAPETHSAGVAAAEKQPVITASSTSSVQPVASAKPTAETTSSSSARPTMVAVSVLCDQCAAVPAEVYCVHCTLKGSQGARLCVACDKTVHTTPLVLAKLGTVGGKKGDAAAQAENVAAQAASVALAADLAKHLRLDLSRSIAPGSKLLAQDLGFIRENRESSALSSVKLALAAIQRQVDEAHDRADKTDRVFASLVVSLATIDSTEEKLGALESIVMKLRVRATETERTQQYLQAEVALLKEQVDNASTTRGRASATFPADSQLGAGSIIQSNTASPGTAKLLHASDLDAHKRSIDSRLAELGAKLDSLRTVEIDALQGKVAFLERNRVEHKALHQISDRLSMAEVNSRSAGNSLAFLSGKVTSHLEAYAAVEGLRGCRHCDTGALAAGGRCEGCGKGICWTCSGKGGHVSEVLSLLPSPGFSFAVSGDDGSTVTSSGGMSRFDLQSALESSPLISSLSARVAQLIDSRDRSSSTIDAANSRVNGVLDTLMQLRLIAPIPGSAGMFKLGPSAAILLDERTLGFYSSLDDLFNMALPTLSQKVALTETRIESISTGLAALERRNREFDVASRPFVDSQLKLLSGQIASLEKGMRKQVRSDLKQFAIDFGVRQAKEREENQRIGAETSFGRVHFKCVACDQIVHHQSGPYSKEFAQSMAAHQQQHHPNPPQSMVGGFATPVPVTHSSAFAGSNAANFANTNPQSSGVVANSIDRGHMFVDPGQRTTLHGTDGMVFRGREDTRVSFTPAAPTGHGDQKQSASFQTGYTKSVITPAGSMQRKVGGSRTARVPFSSSLSALPSVHSNSYSARLAASSGVRDQASDSDDEQSASSGSISARSRKQDLEEKATEQR